MNAKMLQRMKPLCSHFVFFVQHIAAERDKNQEVQQLADCIKSLLHEVLQQAQVFQIQAKQHRVTALPKLH